MKDRGSGILLHITSLPSEYGIGDLGPEAYSFADFLSESGQSYWQVLPINPTLNIYGNSPYNSYSCFAGNELLLSPELLYQKGLLSRDYLDKFKIKNSTRVNFDYVSKSKNELLEIAFSNFLSSKYGKDEFRKFCESNSIWLDNFSLFVSLKDYFNGVCWNQFPGEITSRNFKVLKNYHQTLDYSIYRLKFIQYIFFEQWLNLKSYSNSKNIDIIGDLPIYVNYDSADVWCNPDKFKLDNDFSPLFVSGVPPDYFSKTGQLWGNPVYDWDHMKSAKYEWWMHRLEQNLKLFDIIRLDHFRGFVAYWEVPSSEKTAINGCWIEAPAEDFFSTILEVYDQSNFIAEDLGTITDDVIKIRDMFQFPGMKVLQFAFGDDYPNSSYLPHNHVSNCVVYTGTHDNNTTVGWWRKECSAVVKNRVEQYLKHKPDEKNINWEIIGLAMGSVADKVIIPLQDILGLDEKARMNTPSVSAGNWEWRLDKNYRSEELTYSLKDITKQNNRG